MLRLGRVGRVGVRARGVLGGGMRKRLGVSGAVGRRGYYEWKRVQPEWFLDDWTKSDAVKSWVVDRMSLMQPSRVHLCDGSEAENQKLIQKMVQTGMLVPLNPEIRPDSYLARSPVSDVARVEEKTYICTDSQEDAGPTNNWHDPEQMLNKMNSLFEGCMRGRTMYVIPFSMGPIDSPYSKIGVQITDSPYVVTSMRTMTRMGQEALDKLNDSADSVDFIPCIHTVGHPLPTGLEEDSTWPCNPDGEKYIVHFPEQRRIWSYGSGYGGNALLGKKCFALRIASHMAREEGWLAEHMLIVGVTNPEGKKKYMAAAFPSACGKTNLAMMQPALPGWKVECVGDDIAWMHIDDEGSMHAINPEAGFFGVAPGTSTKSNPYAMKSLDHSVIFTNTAITSDGDVFWEGIGEGALGNGKDAPVPEGVTTWLRTEWDPDSNIKAAHPNARFTVSARQCPVIDEKWEAPEGVKIDAIIFGGRRSGTVPLVYQATSWEHGVFVGASMQSETTAAAAGLRGVLRPDPFAMIPFCGYNMGDYFGHWLSVGKDAANGGKNLPRIFHVNWFRKSPGTGFLWPGFGQNIRVIEWIFNRTELDPSDESNAVPSPIGMLPKEINTDGLDLDDSTMKTIFKIDKKAWTNEISRSRQFFEKFGDRLPAGIKNQLQELEARVSQMP